MQVIRICRVLKLGLAILLIGGAVAKAGMDYPLESELRRIESNTREPFFPGAQHRVAVFTFDDPDGTELGDAVSTLISRSMLFSARVQSFGIVNFQQSAARKTESGLTYFDKVDMITKGHGYSLSLWGHMSDAGDHVVIDTFLQVPSEKDTDAFVRNVRLPKAMGGDELRVILKPDRFRVQSLRIKKDRVYKLSDAAHDVRVLRQ